MLSADYSGANETRERSFQAALAEAAELVAATGGELADIQTAKRDKAHSALFVGTGKAEELAEAVRAHEIELAVFNHELTPTQERNLEKTLQCRVLDRVGLILAIFAQRAQSQEGKLQVELAQCRYEIPSLKGLGHQMSRTGGGIGTRGPGETEFERHRRKLERRIRSITERLEEVRRRRGERRERRRKEGAPLAALVGYTNSGKSTLLKALSKDATILAADQLFSTLDTVVRRINFRDGGAFLLSDTVGFIRKLPPELVAAFRATLEETAGADLLRVVLDASEEDPQGNLSVVLDTLRELEADGLVHREPYSEIPPRVEYTLTPKGRDLLPVFYAICQWGMKYIP